MSNDKTRAAIMAVDEHDDLVMVVNKHCAYDNRGDDLCSTADLKQFVAHLEGERDALRKALEQYADKTNWRRRAGECTERWWSNDANGYETAQAALRGEE